MTLFRHLKLTRPLQLGFLVLLAVCSAQLAYWMIDEVRYTADVQQRLRDAYEDDAQAARAMLRAGVRWQEIARIYPKVSIAPDSTTVVVAPSVLDQLHDQRFHRVNRYAWEGAFFLIVLLGAMAVVYRALREEADLRRRQEHFLAAVSHELRSPLASLRLSVETLALRDPPPPRRAEIVQRLLADLGRLQRMIANILDASRLSAAEARTAPEHIELSEEATAVIDEMRDQAIDGASRIRAEVHAGLVVHADPEGVRTVLRNLLLNAIKATTGGGEVVVRGVAEAGRVRLEVRDDGIGFPPHEAERLFEKFYRVESDARTRPGGTGLGLYLVWRCVELDRGTVTAESAGPGLGALFTVTWPAVTEAVR